MRRVRFAGLLAGALASAAVGASELRFVALTEADIAATVPAWPADDSLAGRADLQVVVAVERARDALLADEAERDATRGPVQWAAFVLGPRFDPERLPRTVALLEALHEDLRRVQRAANAAFPTRPRPWMRDAGVLPSLRSERAGSGPHFSSYPSARTMASQVWAHALAALFPDARTALEAAADRTAWLRVAGGAHYPSDLAGGRAVAMLVVAKLGQSTVFAHALDAARAEIAALDTPRIAPVRSNAAPSYLAIARTPLAAILPAPSPPDLEAVRHARSARSAAAAAEAIRLDRADVWSFVQDALGVRVGPRAAPRIEAFLARVRDDLEHYIVAARAAYAIPRPQRRDPEIAPLLAVPDNSSYPSAKVWSIALQLELLGDLFPSARARWAADVAALGRSRVVAGVHYPGDVEGAREAARRMAARIRASDAYRGEHSALEREAAALRPK
jgi:acid phosphatase (class A)